MKHFAALAALIAPMIMGAAPATATAIFAGGCFWSVEHDLEHLPGVKDVVVGYAGGASRNPTYRNHEGHLEAVKITYDPSKTTYARLVDGFFRHIDPTDPNGQICDQGPSYRTAVFAGNPIEQRIAEQVKAGIGHVLKKTIATEIRGPATFWMGEDYHQDYAAKNPMNYNAYRIGCGRDAALARVWGR